MSAAERQPPADQEGSLGGDPEPDGAAPAQEATEPGDAPPSGTGAAAAAEPRRGVDDPVLPSQTADDTDPDWRDQDDSGDDRYLRERPPHW